MEGPASWAYISQGWDTGCNPKADSESKQADHVGPLGNATWPAAWLAV